MLNKTDLRKEYSNTLKDAREESKASICILCGKALSSTCKSHSIPSFILRNISNEGYVYQPRSLKMALGALMNDKIGVGSAGVFKEICNDCDNKWFSTYESEEAIGTILKDDKELKTKKLASIFLKASILELSKKKISKHFYPILSAKSKDRFFAPNNKDVEEMNISEHKMDIQKSLSLIRNKYQNGFKVLFERKLPYKVGIASQIVICLQTDLKGNIVNDTFNMNSKIRMHDICICVFPQKSTTIVLMYCMQKAYKTYKQFHQQFLNLNEKDKLHVIQSILISHSEEVFYSKTVYESICREENIMELFGQGFNDHPRFINDIVIMGPERVKITNFRLIENYFLKR